MIRVLQVFGRMDRGGAETMIMNIYRNIDRTKVQFDFAVHTTDKCDFDDEIKRLGGRIYSVPKYSVKNALVYRKNWQNLLSKHPEWTIVHSHIRSTASIILSVADKLGKVTIAHSHSISSGKGVKAIIKTALQKQIKADYYMACSNAAGEWLFGKETVKSDIFFVLPNAICVNDFKFDLKCRSITRKKLGVTDEVLIGHIGRFVTEKNHSFLIEVFKEIAYRTKKARILLVGRGELEEPIKKRVEELGLQDKTIFAGVRSDVNELLQAMDLFVFPSLYEGLGIVLVEAQTSGLRCVLSDKVPKEAIMSDDLVTIKSLNDSASDWAEHILSRVNYERVGCEQQIKEKGYDISSTSKWLEEFYLEKGR